MSYDELKRATDWSKSCQVTCSVDLIPGKPGSGNVRELRKGQVWERCNSETVELLIVAAVAVILNSFQKLNFDL